jgi:hypothetical protein
MENTMSARFPKTAANLAYEAKGGSLVPLVCGCGAWIGWTPSEWVSGINARHLCVACAERLAKRGAL